MAFRLTITFDATGMTIPTMQDVLRLAADRLAFEDYGSSIQNVYDLGGSSNRQVIGRVTLSDYSDKPSNSGLIAKETRQ